MRKTIKQKLIDQMSPEWGNQAWTFDRINMAQLKLSPRLIMLPRYANMNLPYNWELMQRAGMVRFFRNR